jgi:FkbM family methyltransferase
MFTSLLFAHPRAIAWRNQLRRNAFAQRLYSRIAGRGGYEARFSRELLAAIRTGDTVWDIGANVGFYAAQFLKRGAANVVCFEPAAAAVSVLQERFGGGSRNDNAVRVVPVALGRRRSSAVFTADGASPNNQIVATTSDVPTVEVQVYAGDEAQAEFALPTPDVIKIDVEGFELDVIQGLPGVLASKMVRSVFIEVHFSLLHSRGIDDAPASLIQIMKNQGFRVHWIDPSHLGAYRDWR